MKPKVLAAILLIALGVVAFAYQGITYTTQSKGVDFGNVHVSTDQTHHIPLPPILGAIALIGGIALLLVNKRGLRAATTP